MGKLLRVSIASARGSVSGLCCCDFCRPSMGLGARYFAYVRSYLLYRPPKSKRISTVIDGERNQHLNQSKDRVFFHFEKE